MTGPGRFKLPVKMTRTRSKMQSLLLQSPSRGRWPSRRRGHELGHELGHHRIGPPRGANLMMSFRVG